MCTFVTARAAGCRPACLQGSGERSGPRERCGWPYIRADGTGAKMQSPGRKGGTAVPEQRRTHTECCLQLCGQTASLHGITESFRVEKTSEVPNPSPPHRVPKRISTAPENLQQRDPQPCAPPLFGEESLLKPTCTSSSTTCSQPLPSYHFDAFLPSGQPCKGSPHHHRLQDRQEGAQLSTSPSAFRLWEAPQGRMEPQG